MNILGLKHRWTTNQHKKYWEDRKIDWNTHYTATWNHPHRQFIVDKLKELKWISIVEIGCASGPNLIKIAMEIPRADVGGIDLNKDAILTAQKIFSENKRNAWFKVGNGESVKMSDGSVDMVLSDMALIYVGRTKIKKHISEMHRICRKGVILLEFHHKSWWKRFVQKVKSGYNVYNYKKLLEEQGFYDVQVDKLPPEMWENHEPQKTFAYRITAKK